MANDYRCMMKNVKPKSAVRPAKAKSATTGRARTEPKTIYSKAEIEEIFRRFSIQRPEPKGELEHVNPFTLVVAVALSAQATDAASTRRRGRFSPLPTRRKRCWRSARSGFATTSRPSAFTATRRRTSSRSREKLIAEFGGEVPRTREELITLPGVGRKTANVVLSMAFGQATMAVDTHIFRIANRLCLAPGKTPDEIEHQLMQIIPDHYLYHAHHWLILHGRYCCKARKPECQRCVIADICKAAGKDQRDAGTAGRTAAQII
jgi:endonuclease-3